MSGESRTIVVSVFTFGCENYIGVVEGWVGRTAGFQIKVEVVEALLELRRSICPKGIGKTVRTTARVRVRGERGSSLFRGEVPMDVVGRGMNVR